MMCTHHRTVATDQRALARLAEDCVLLARVDAGEGRNALITAGLQESEARRVVAGLRSHDSRTRETAMAALTTFILRLAAGSPRSQSVIP